MSSSENSYAKIMKTGPIASSKTIQRKLSLEFGFKSCEPGRKLCLTQTIKKNCLDFAELGHKDVEKGTFGRAFCKLNTLLLEAYWATLGGKVLYLNCETFPSQIIWGAMLFMGTAELYFLPPGTTTNAGKYTSSSCAALPTTITKKKKEKVKKLSSYCC